MSVFIFAICVGLKNLSLFQGCKCIFLYLLWKILQFEIHIKCLIHPEFCFCVQIEERIHLKIFCVMKLCSSVIYEAGSPLIFTADTFFQHILQVHVHISASQHCALPLSSPGPRLLLFHIVYLLTCNPLVLLSGRTNGLGLAFLTLPYEFINHFINFQKKKSNKLQTYKNFNQNCFSLQLNSGKSGLFIITLSVNNVFLSICVCFLCIFYFLQKVFIYLVFRVIPRWLILFCYYYKFYNFLDIFFRLSLMSIDFIFGKLTKPSY